jgi:hypothetical protein
LRAENRFALFLNPLAGLDAPRSQAEDKPMLRASLILTAVLLAAPALAQAPPPDAGDPPQLSQEFISPMGEPFRAVKDVPYPSEAWFKQADANGDGVITREEFRADAARFFKTLDKDDDGYIDDGEITIYETAVAPEIKLAMDSDQGPAAAFDYDTYRGAGDEAPQRIVDDASRITDSRDHDAASGKRHVVEHRQGAGIFSYFNEPEPIRADDTNVDFRVSLKEWMTAADRRFDALDLRHDGKLVRGELPMTPFQEMLIKVAKQTRKK